MTVSHERTFEHEVPSGTEPMRVDQWVAAACREFSRSVAADDATVFLLNGKQVKKSRKVHGGDLVSVRWTEQVFERVEAQDIPLHIIYEDSHVLVIDKQQGLVVHPGAGNPGGTLANALVHRYGERFFSVEETDDEDEDTLVRPGIVHRLDKDTSGVMVIALDRESHQSLAAQFKARTVEKHYIAIVCGQPPREKGRIETTLVRDKRDRKRFATGSQGEGKVAVTEYRVLHRFGTHALVRVRLLTGRTHQIRVHMRHIGCPILGDAIYGRTDVRFKESDMMLHALSLALDHPFTGARMRFTAPMPQRFKLVLRALVR